MREALREAQAKVESYLTAINAVIITSSALLFLFTLDELLLKIFFLH